MQEQVTIMMTYYRTDDQVIHEEEKLSDGVWVQMINPTHDECEEIAEKLMVDIDDVKAALDVEESSRIELQDGYTLILVDIPAIEIRHDQRTYTTIPLGIILTQDIIVTICTEDTPVLQNFVRSRVKEFSTKKKLRFVYQILYRTAAIYQANLRIIDKRRTEIEERVGSDTDDSDLINLHELESTLVYFATSLRANVFPGDNVKMNGVKYFATEKPGSRLTSTSTHISIGKDAISRNSVAEPAYTAISSARYLRTTAVAMCSQRENFCFIGGLLVCGKRL